MSPYRPLKKPNVPTKPILESKAYEIQRRLSDQGKYVLWQEIIYELLNQYEGCAHIGDLGLLQADHLQTINDLIRLQKRIDTFLIAYEVRLPCVTLLELEQSICNDYNYAIANNTLLNNNNNNNTNNTNCKITKYEELFVGPLIRNQIIRQIFNLTEETRSIEQMSPIRLISMLKHLENYLNENDLWSKKIKQVDFEAYLMNKLKVNSLSLLGIKINNIGMLIGSIKNVQYCYGQTLNEVKLKLADDWSQLLEKEKKILIKSLDEKFKSIYVNKKSSIILIDDLIGCFEKLFNKIEMNNISSFLRTIQQTSYLRDCFQLAICFGNNEIDKLLNEMEQHKEMDYDQMYTPGNYCYFSFMKRIFNLVFDASNSSGRDVKRFLNNLLGESKLKIVSSKGHIKFNDDDDDDEDGNNKSVDQDKVNQDSIDESKFETSK